MGHLTGSISDLVFENRDDSDAFCFFDTNGGYSARRRILPRPSTVVNEGICNTAFWLANAVSSSAAHGSATASARFLAACGVRLLAGEWGTAEELPPLGPHFANIGRAPLTAAGGLAQAAWTMAAARVTRRRYRPRRFLTAGDGGWRLAYHSEQKSNPANRITLSGRTDSIGLPKLHIDFHFSETDAATVIRAHELLDKDLRKAGAGWLRWTSKDALTSIIASARDGYHQIGGATMSTHPAHGVVDKHCRVHELDNLWIASSCVFPSGGQANPTLTIMALACRLADHIASLRQSSPAQITILAPRQQVC
jgi:choline dehydrogenase-like flavoprotein